MGLFEKLARDHFLSEKEPKIKFFDFGAIQKIMKMLSREKIIFQMLFGASHGTPHNVCRIIFEIDLSTIAYHFQDPNVQYFCPKLPARVYMQRNNVCICPYR